MSALTNLSENASRLGMRLQEQLSEHTRDFQFTKSGASAYLDLSDEKLRTIRKQLDSSSDRDKLDAMKRLVAVLTVSCFRSRADYDTSSSSLFQKGGMSLNTLPK